MIASIHVDMTGENKEAWKKATLSLMRVAGTIALAWQLVDCRVGEESELNVALGWGMALALKVGTEVAAELGTGAAT